MKTVITVLLIIVLVFTLIALGMLSMAINGNFEQPATCERYALTTCVVEVDRDNNIVTCEDSNGNLWEFYGCEDWQEGDCASLLMNDQGTQSIYDDAIEGARYSAWTLMR